MNTPDEIREWKKAHAACPSADKEPQTLSEYLGMPPRQPAQEATPKLSDVLFGGREAQRDGELDGITTRRLRSKSRPQAPFVPRPGMLTRQARRNRERFWEDARMVFWAVLTVVVALVFAALVCPDGKY